MSEIGIAIYDTRSPRSPSQAASNAQQSTSTVVLEDLAKNVIARHVLIDEWKAETEVTCNAFWHRNRGNKPGRPQFITNQSHGVNSKACDWHKGLRV